MNGIGTFGLLAFVLQLTVPSYSLRLVRRFGTARVGWFVVTAFSVLALLQLLKPLRSSLMGSSGTAMDLVVSAAIVLLVIGMGHLETILSAEQAAERDERKIRAECETLAEGKQNDLARINEELLQKIASLEKAEQTIRQSEGEYRFLFAENPQPMWIFDLCTLRFLAVNKAALRQYGFTEEEFASLSVRDIIPSDMVARFQSDAARPCSTAQLRGRWQHYRKDRTLMDVEVTALDLRYGGYPARLVLVADTSARAEEKKQYFEERRQQVTGQLAGGVAHYINNILSIISGHVSILAHKQPNDQNAEHIAQISNAVNTAAGLSRQLLIASGHFPLKPELIDLNVLLRGMQPTLARLVGREIQIQTILGMEMPQIPADPRLLEHVILNVVLNARDAMTCGGTITIRTESVRLGESSFGERALSRTGNFVRLAVRDIGCGLSQEAREHLFEPFFSTRGVGKGRGLGLASVHGAVRQHGGWIDYTSETGKGTEFSIFLPEVAPVLKNTETQFHRRMRC